uniref:OB domain-containing protein n=1 Tax=Candidatus Methanophaga sp. ANME-1 ERB7 TaxID=2759913 RepID=A0A7G9Z420_9EURY|nr:hypothetical protein IIFEDBNN_00011 [Methanosarcinales archaeon ANME-1 ERB7]QNO55004.1 hypothetical protein KIHMDPCI_00015 [Methanosarcinales archaeon ANME-1 ERB7]
MATITGKVLRILAFNSADEAKEVVDLIIADEYDYTRVSLWDDKAELVRCGELKAGDVLRIENASEARSEKRANAGKNARITKLATDIHALSHANSSNLTVLAVARPEKGQVCIAGIDENGEWIRPQGVYETDVFGSGSEKLKTLGISKVYVDAWRGRHPRKEDRYFVFCDGPARELNAEKRREFLDRYTDESVDAVFKSGRSLGLIKPRILQVYEERKKKKKGEKSHELYIRFNFKDASGRVYRRWSCRCSDFYNTWNELKRTHRWTYGWRMLRYLRQNDTYLAIGLTYTDYGSNRLEYDAYPMIVGVHVLA